MKKKPLFRTFMCAALIGSLLAPVAVQADTGTAAKTKEQSKISSALYKRFEKEGKVTFLIKMKSQANLQQAATAAEKRAKASVMTVKKAKEIKRSAVLTSLRTKAERTQKDLKSFLEKEEKKGTAKKVESFYIVNGIAVTATKDVMEKAASFPEVEKVLPNQKIKLGNTEKPTVESKTTADPHPCLQH